MLQLTVSLTPEMYDENTNRFIKPKTTILQLEHSLVSLSKWESKFCRPFLSKMPMSVEESVYYIRCMTITQNVAPDVYDHISTENMTEVMTYIELPMTATTFSKPSDKATNREVITAEIIYWWMITLTIPPDYQKWHLNRLLTLINVCNLKNQPKKKMSAKERADRDNALNEARKAKLGTTG